MDHAQASGAPAPQAVTGDSTTPTAAPTYVSDSDRALSIVQRYWNGEPAREAGEPQPPAASSSAAGEMLPDGTPQEGAAPPAEGQSAEPPKDGNATAAQDPDPIPFAVFKARIGEERLRAREAKAELLSAQRQVASLEAANKLLAEQLDAIRGGRLRGEPYDAKADEMALRELRLRAQEAEKGIEAQHEQAMREHQLALKVAQANEEIEAEIASALRRYPLLSRVELRAAMHDDKGRQHALHYAQQLHAQREAIARQMYGAPQGAPSQAPPNGQRPPYAPQTARASSSGPAQRFEPTVEGATRYLRSLGMHG